MRDDHRDVLEVDQKPLLQPLRYVRVHWLVGWVSVTSGIVYLRRGCKWHGIRCFLISHDEVMVTIFLLICSKIVHKIWLVSVRQKLHSNGSNAPPPLTNSAASEVSYMA
jgi:hypothetical protein